MAHAHAIALGSVRPLLVLVLPCLVLFCVLFQYRKVPKTGPDEGDEEWLVLETGGQGVQGVCVRRCYILLLSSLLPPLQFGLQNLIVSAHMSFLLSFVAHVPPEFRNGACTAMALISHGCGLVNAAHNRVTSPVSHQHALADTGSSVSLSRSLPFNTRTNHFSPF